MIPIIITVLALLGILTLIGGIAWIVRHFDRKRTEALAQVAAEKKMGFLAKGDGTLREKMKTFALFNKGHSRKLKNVMKADTEIAQLCIFDYQYTVGGGQNSRTYVLSVASFESDEMQLPDFSLRPEGFFQRLGAAFGMQDIDFKDHPEFSNRFVLTGKDESAIRRFFDSEILELFAQRKGVCVETIPRLFIYVRPRKKPSEIQEFMDEAFSVYSAFRDRMERGSVE